MLASVGTDFDQPIFTDYAHVNQPIDTNADPFVARDQLVRNFPVRQRPPDLRR
jgi:hypothetical protein